MMRVVAHTIVIGYSLLYCLIGLLLTLLFSILGKHLDERYSDLASIFEPDESPAYNALLRCLAAPIVSVFLAIALFSLPSVLGHDNFSSDFPGFLNGVWLISVWLFFWQFVIVLLLGRVRLLNLGKFVVYHLVSVFLSFLVTRYAIAKGLTFLVPDEANFRTELWFIVILFFFHIAEKLPLDQVRWERRKRRYLQINYAQLKSRYGKFLLGHDLLFQHVVFGIMLFENYNRSRLLRWLERRLFFFGRAKSTGIMQVQSNKVLSDEESVQAAITLLLPHYQDAMLAAEAASKGDEWVARSHALEILTTYNPGESYKASVSQIIYELEQIDKPAA